MGHNRRVTRDDVSSTHGDEDSTGKRRRGQDFPLTGWLRRGYDCREVETFLHEIERALRHVPPAMAPYEVQDARFRGVRLRRGYEMRAVDERMQELHVELREAHGAHGVAVIHGHESERHHRAAFWIYVVAAVLVGAMLVFALTQMI
jgi:DivIVA domain-containing protein